MSTALSRRPKPPRCNVIYQRWGTAEDFVCNMPACENGYCLLHQPDTWLKRAQQSHENAITRANNQYARQLLEIEAAVGRKKRT